MEPASAVHQTFVLEREYPVSTSKLFAAFTDPDTKRRWFFEGEHHDLLEFKSVATVGGEETASYKMKPGTPIAGVVLTTRGVHLDVAPEHRIVIASSMAMDGRIFSTSMVTFELLPTETGTVLICTHQGAFFEGADGPERREGGWRALLDSLAAVL